MHYLDTSVLVTALTTEAAADRVRRWLTAHESFYISPWVQTEFASTLSRKLREGTLDESGCAVARAGLVQLRRDSIATLPVESQHFFAAEEMCDAGIGLRASDALHLAVASGSGLALVSRDVRFVAASRSFGLEAINPDEVA